MLSISSLTNIFNRECFAAASHGSFFDSHTIDLTRHELIAYNISNIGERADRSLSYLHSKFFVSFGVFFSLRLYSSMIEIITCALFNVELILPLLILRLRITGLTRETTYHLILLIFPMSRGAETGPAMHHHY